MSFHVLRTEFPCINFRIISTLRRFCVVHPLSFALILETRRQLMLPYFPFASAQAHSQAVAPWSSQQPFGSPHQPAGPPQPLVPAAACEPDTEWLRHCHMETIMAGRCFLEERHITYNSQFQRVHDMRQTPKGHWQAFCAWAVGKKTALECNACILLWDKCSQPADARIHPDSAAAPSPPPLLDASASGAVEEPVEGALVWKGSGAKRLKIGRPPKSSSGSSDCLQGWLQEHRPGMYEALPNASGKHPYKCLLCGAQFNAIRTTSAHHVERHERDNTRHRNLVQDRKAEKETPQSLCACSGWHLEEVTTAKLPGSCILSEVRELHGTTTHVIISRFIFASHVAVAPPRHTPAIGLCKLEVGDALTIFVESQCPGQTVAAGQDLTELSIDQKGPYVRSARCRQMGAASTYNPEKAISCEDCFAPPRQKELRERLCKWAFKLDSLELAKVRQKGQESEIREFCEVFLARTYLAQWTTCNNALARAQWLCRMPLARLMDEVAPPMPSSS